MEIILYTPHERQLEIHRALLDPTIFYVTAVIGRQFGKSTLGWNQAVMWALSEGNQIVYWVSPTDTQAKKIYTTIVNAIFESGVIKSHKMGSGDCEIIFKNKSKILFRSAAAEDSLRGESVHYMILDEAAFIKKTTLNSILLPMLTIIGKKCLVITTPKGKNWVYDWFLKGQEGKSRYKSFRLSSIDSPFANLEFIEEQRRGMPEKLYQQEYLAEFVDSASIFNNLQDIMVLQECNEPIEGEKYYSGIDIGMINDASVMSVLDSVGNLVKYYRFEKMEAPELMNEIVRINNIWKFKKVMIENNNQGLTIYQDLKRRMNNIIDFNTNQKTKPEIINQLIHLFNTKGIKTLEDELLRIELEAYIFTQTPNGVIKYGADNGFFDDIVIALAIGRHCFNTNQYDVKFAGLHTRKVKDRY